LIKQTCQDKKANFIYELKICIYQFYLKGVQWQNYSRKYFELVTFKKHINVNNDAIWFLSLFVDVKKVLIKWVGIFQDRSANAQTPGKAWASSLSIS